MAHLLRGDVRWADLTTTKGHEQAGHRPVLILSHDIFNSRSGTVIAVALTSQPQRAGFPLAFELTDSEDGQTLPKRTWVKVSQMRTLSVDRIGKRLWRASPEELARILEGLNEILS